MNKKFNVLYLIIGINLLVFILAFLVYSNFGFDADLFYLFGGLIPSDVFQGSLWLLITSGFFHLEIFHFLLNMFSLYRIGQVVQFYYDDRKLFITYVLGVLGGSFLTYLFSIITGENIYTLGASGAVFALIGLILGGSLKKYRYGINLPISPMDVLPFIVISFLFGFIPGFRVNNFAHLGGFVVGVVLGLLFQHSHTMKVRFDNSITRVLFSVSVTLFAFSFLAMLSNAYNILVK